MVYVVAACFVLFWNMVFSSMVDEDLSFSFCSVGHSENFFCKYCQDGLPIVSDQCFSFFLYYTKTYCGVL